MLYQGANNYSIYLITHLDSSRLKLIVYFLEHSSWFIRAPHLPCLLEHSTWYIETQNDTLFTRTLIWIHQDSNRYSVYLNAYLDSSRLKQILYLLEHASCFIKTQTATLLTGTVIFIHQASSRYSTNWETNLDSGRLSQLVCLLEHSSWLFKTQTATLFTGTLILIITTQIATLFTWTLILVKTQTDTLITGTLTLIHQGSISWFLYVLRFYGQVNPMGSCRVRSVYLTTRLLGRLSPLSG